MRVTRKAVTSKLNGIPSATIKLTFVSAAGFSDLTAMGKMTRLGT